MSVLSLPWNLNLNPFSPKQSSGIFNNQKFDESIQYALRALDEDCKGDTDVAIDLYFEALSSLLDALPENKDVKKNKLIKHKFTSLIARKFQNFVDEPPAPRRTASESNLFGLNKKDAKNKGPLYQTDKEGNIKPVTLSDRVVQAAVAGAVALKQSPLPDAVRSTVSYTLEKAQAIDKYIGVQNMCWEVSKVGITKAIELDEQYNLHEKVSAAIMTSATAVIKAGIAYQEATAYKDMQKAKD